jgi:hypothetical protein
VRIGPPRREDTEDGPRISATIVWEDADRPPFDMWFERKGSEPLADDLHPFLLGAIVPAWRHGERRVRVEGSVCPRLRDGLRAATGLLSQWFSPGREVLAIEAAGGFHPFRRRSDRAALFLTGGVDSMHVLHANRAMFPPDHPGAFRDAVYAIRLAFLEAEPSARAVNLARRQSEVIAKVSAAAGLEPVFVDSNFRNIESDVWLAGTNDHAALLAAIAHAVAPRVGAVSLAASFDMGFLYGWGTHPMLDPLFSSTGVELRCEGYGPSRLEKVAAIARWPLARENLIVCFEGPLPEGRLNCGRCEKCLRTMTALLVVGALDGCAAFGGEGVTADKIDAMPLGYVPRNLAEYWGPFVGLLERRGEREIARAVRRKIGQARRMIAFERDEGARARIRRLDRKYLGGTLARVRRGLRVLGR